jgi:galactokinase
LTAKHHGGGVSSSAAVIVAILLALGDVNGLSLSAEENIELSRQVENDFLGVRSGILDPAAILLSRRGRLTWIDCRTSRFELIPPAPSIPAFKILLAFSGLTKALWGTDYNRRVDECALAARTLLAAAGHVDRTPVLGNVTADEYSAHKHRLRGAPARRAEHFFSEGERVRQGVASWKKGDLGTFGVLMNASGESSICDYECGCPPLVDLYQTLVATEGVYGARFSGAGFRGCCVALVQPQALEQVAGSVRAAYARRHPELAECASMVPCDTADGASIMTATAAASP